MMFSSFPSGGSAVILGASGAIGSAVISAAKSSGQFAKVIGFARPAFDITVEHAIAAAATAVQADTGDAPLRLVLVATGLLHKSDASGEAMPEKGLRQLAPEFMAENFAVNAIGPALAMKHFLPLMARDGKALFAVISAKVASLGDNQLGGWHSYRASKVALNMYVKNAAIEMARTRPAMIVTALHPGTVESKLSAPFHKTGLDVRSPNVAAEEMIGVMDSLTPQHSGGFFNHKGETLPW
jgi:NAD(P)-dependent dehydrogenase (short-subunit alcohol dehydrogenase family)